MSMYLKYDAIVPTSRNPGANHAKLRDFRVVLFGLYFSGSIPAHPLLWRWTYCFQGLEEYRLCGAVVSGGVSTQHYPDMIISYTYASTIHILTLYFMSSNRPLWSKAKGGCGNSMKCRVNIYTWSFHYRYTSTTYIKHLPVAKMNKYWVYLQVWRQYATISDWQNCRKSVLF